MGDHRERSRVWQDDRKAWDKNVPAMCTERRGKQEVQGNVRKEGKEREHVSAFRNGKILVVTLST